MTRLEDNGMVVKEMIKRSELKPTGTYEELVTFHLGTIATMLTDISKSLAILADKADSRSDGFFGDDRDSLTQEQIENLQ